jgi:hypothetical protein|tara:strand:+ start:16830 stop:17591 length:762 start_codon:yes stop_codon:yes gene_type:complete
MNTNRVYTVGQGIRQRIRTQERRGFTVDFVTLTLLNEDLEIHSWDSDSNHISTSLKREIQRHPASTQVHVQIIDNTNDCLWEGTYSLNRSSTPSQIQEHSFSGPTFSQPHDIGALVEQQVQEIRQREELERLRKEQTELKVQNEDLLGQVESLEAQIEAKSKLEYYSKVAGDLLPGIAKALEKTSFGPTLSGLTGMNMENDDHATVMESAKQLIESLTEEQLSAFYMLVLELQNNPTLIPALYQNSFSHETTH